MHRLNIESSVLESERPVLPPQAARHLKVLRPSQGEKFELFDGCGAWRVYEYRQGALVASGPVQRAGKKGGRLALFACITKSSRWDWTIEKATELGVDEIFPVVSERTIVRIHGDDGESKRARWERLAAEAAGQCGTRFVPRVHPPVDFAAALAVAARYRVFACVLTDPPPPPLLDAASGFSGEDADAAVFTGPEGDFTPDELSKLLEVAVPVSLGPFVLRAETACVYALSVLSALKTARGFASPAGAF